MNTAGAAMPIPVTPEGDGDQMLKFKDKEKEKEEFKVKEEIKELSEIITKRALEVETPVIVVNTQPQIKSKVADELKEQILVMPIRPENRPTGLEDLMCAERLQVSRKLHLASALFLKGKRNRFFIRTADDKLAYEVAEENTWWVGYCCYGLRPMFLRVLDQQGMEVIRIERPFAFTTRVMPCQLQTIRVYSPPDRLIGSAIQLWTPVKPHYAVRNSAGIDVFEVHGPRITLSCFQDVQFQMTRPNGALVASTDKRWEGLMHALFLAPVTDKFSITYHDESLSGEERALLLATALLLDYMYYDV